MAKIICFENNIGRLEIITLAPEMFDPESATRKDLQENGVIFANEMEMMEWVAQKDSKGYPYHILDDSLLPSDRMYRNAWSLDADKKSIEIPLEKAKPLHQDIIRNARNAKFDAADVEFNKSVEKVLEKLTAGGDADPDVIALKEAIKKRNDLRDAPEIDLSDVQTIDELKSKVPDVLKP